MIRRFLVLLFVLGVIVGGRALPVNAQLGLLDDFGDAPASYGSVSHSLLLGNVPPFWMGRAVLGFDTDFTDQPSVGARDDDCNTFEGGLIPIPVSCLPAPLSIVNDLLTSEDNFILDDEDGVNMGALIPNQQTPVAITVTAPGMIDAWIDWNRDGDFDTTDRIFTHQPVAGGQNALQFIVPNITDAGVTYARFRFSHTGESGPTGLDSSGGEVEDYGVVINQDFGDAPDDQAVATDFPTTIASNGARHRLTQLKMGQFIDGEPDGAASPNALGDDANPIGGPDDEDGVTFSGPFIAGQDVTAHVSVQGAGGGGAKLDAWADFNGDHDWADGGEKIANSASMSNGTNSVTIHVPLTAAVGSMTTRWRLSTAGGLNFTGLANDGEVEDHQVTVQPQGSAGALDFGDAPEAGTSYPTTLAHDGARNAIGDLFLGTHVDSEADGQPSAGATLDDTNGVPDDEDGITFETSLVPGRQGKIDVVASGTGLLDGWIDANFDGDWEDNGEHVVDSQIVTACGALDTQNPPQCTHHQEITFTMPPGNHFGSGALGTYARFRLSSGGTNAPEGFVPDGETEDYQVSVTLECGATVIGNFTLPFSLNCPGNGPAEDGLFVGADATNIDLNGNTISGDDINSLDRGISLGEGLTHANDVTIHNGVISDFGGGIDLVGDRVTIDTVNVEQNHGNGIKVDGDHLEADTVRSVDNEGDGLHNVGDDLNVHDSFMDQNSGGDGIDFNGPGAKVIATSASENHDAGITGTGGDAVVQDSGASRNSGQGIHIIGQNAFASGNTVDDNLGNGINLEGNRGRANNNTSVSGNGGDGIRMGGPSGGDFDQVLANLAVNDNAQDGIHMIIGKKIFVRDNTALRNGDDGIDVEKAARGRVNQNHLGHDNGNRAVEAHAHVSGPNNHGRPCKPSNLCSGG